MAALLGPIPVGRPEGVLPLNADCDDKGGRDAPEGRCVVDKLSKTFEEIVRVTRLDPARARVAVESSSPVGGFSVAWTDTRSGDWISRCCVSHQHGKDVPVRA